MNINSFITGKPTRNDQRPAVAPTPQHSRGLLTGSFHLRKPLLSSLSLALAIPEARQGKFASQHLIHPAPTSHPNFSPPNPLHHKTRPPATATKHAQQPRQQPLCRISVRIGPRIRVVHVYDPHLRLLRRIVRRVWLAAAWVHWVAGLPRLLVCRLRRLLLWVGLLL